MELSEYQYNIVYELYFQKIQTLKYGVYGEKRIKYLSFLYRLHIEIIIFSYAGLICH